MREKNDDIAVIEVQTEEDWESFKPMREEGIFLQSWKAKELNESLGQTTWMLRLQQGGEILGQALITQINAKRGRFLFIPYGPICREWKKEVSEVLFQSIRELAHRQKADFIRCSPSITDTPEHHRLFASLGFRESPIHMLAETGWSLNLTDQTEEALLNGMEKKHRNLIRRAEKEGVSVTSEHPEQGLEEFLHLYRDTAKRHNFTPYSEKLLRNQLLLFGQSNRGQHNQALLLRARYNNVTLAAGIFMYYGRGAFYHHGASTSDPLYRKIPASYLLQWEAIREALRRDAAFYSFWGIAPYTISEKGERVYSNPRHPFVGITHFKTGFGGSRRDLLPCLDLPLTPKYHLTRLIESLRKWKRGF